MIKTALGKNIEDGEILQHTVMKNRWFASCVANDTDFSLVGCTVSPGFDFRDFELGNRESLLKTYPHLEEAILKLTR